VLCGGHSIFGKEKETTKMYSEISDSSTSTHESLRILGLAAPRAAVSLRD
jgi:hypothetical protein